MKKQALLLLLITALLSTAAAEGISGEFNQNNTQLPPNEETHIGDLEITAEEELLNIRAFLNFNFNTRIDPDSLNSLNENQSATMSIYGTADQPGDFSRPLQIVSDEHSFEENIDLTVSEESKLSINKTEIQENVSTGTEGQLAQVPLKEEGNANHGINAEINGEIDRIIDIDPYKFLKGGSTQDFNITYDAPSDAEIKEYDGNITFTSEELDSTASINVSLNVLDETAPTIKGTSFEDVMATQNTSFVVEAEDNNKVKNVTAEIYKDEDSADEEEFIDELEFSKSDDSNLWRQTFNQTENIGSYSANISVVDEAGNMNETREEFEVTELDSTSITEDNFRVSAIRQGETAERELFTNSKDTPVTIELSRLGFDGNSSVEIGIKHENHESANYFSEEGDSIDFDELGRYNLVVESRGEEPVHGTYDFDAELDFTVPDQHVDLGDGSDGSTVVFSGQINSDEYPDPQNIVLDEYREYIGYENIVEEFEREHGSIQDNEETAYLLASIPADTCRGDTEWGECSSLSLGEYERIDGSADEAERKLRNRTYIFILLSLILVGSTTAYWRVEKMDDYLAMEAH